MLLPKCPADIDPVNLVFRTALAISYVPGFRCLPFMQSAGTWLRQRIYQPASCVWEWPQLVNASHVGFGAQGNRC